MKFFLTLSIWLFVTLIKRIVTEFLFQYKEYDIYKMFETVKIIILYPDDESEWYKPVQVFFNNIVIRVSFFQ